MHIATNQAWRRANCFRSILRAREFGWKRRGVEDGTVYASTKVEVGLIEWIAADNRKGNLETVGVHLN